MSAIETLINDTLHEASLHTSPTDREALAEKAQAELAALRAERDALADTIAELRAENTRLQSLVNKLGDPSQNPDFKWHDLYGWMQQDQHSCVTDDIADLKAERDQYREIAGELGEAGEALRRIVWYYKGETGKEALEKFDTTLARWTEMEKGKV